jgi:phage shock protein PspC (stress-responsive transcriptional regulator)
VNLTQKQNQRIAKYLRDIDLQLGTLSDKARDAARARLRARIETELRQFQNRDPEDHEIEAILASCGTTSRVAAELLGKHGGMDALALSTERKWLGVCAGVARRFDMDVRIVRAVAVAFGVVTGPFSLMGYLALYLNLYLASEDDTIPRVDRAHFLRMLLGALGGVMALYIGSGVVQVLVFGAYTKFSPHTRDSLADWNGLAAHSSSMFFWSVITLLPMAALAGLPLPDGWDKTAKKLVQAGIALYAVAICFGIASLLAGIIIQLVRDFAV